MGGGGAAGAGRESCDAQPAHAPARGWSGGRLEARPRETLLRVLRPCALAPRPGTALREFFKSLTAPRCRVSRSEGEKALDQWRDASSVRRKRSVQFSRSVVSNSLRRHTAARQATVSITNSQSPPKPMSIESVMSSGHLILCRPFLLPSIFPSIRVFSNESALRNRWPKYWSFSFNHQSFQ